jgi:hypothetical protein
MRQIHAIASSVARACSPVLVVLAIGSGGAKAGDPQISKFTYGQPAAPRILVCPETIAPANCNTLNALAVLARAPGKDIGCGVQGPQILAGSGYSATENQYVRVDCARPSAQSD